MLRLNQGYSIRDWNWKTSRKEWDCQNCDRVIPKGAEYLNVRCSIAGWGIKGPFHFCGNCGATLFDLVPIINALVNASEEEIYHD